MGRESAYLLLLFTVVSESAHRVDVRCVWYVYVRTKLNDATSESMNLENAYHAPDAPVTVTRAGRAARFTG